MIPLKYNIRNLVVRWIPTLLMVLVFMPVVAMLVVMLAFVEGLNALSKKTGPEGNVIILRDGATDEIFSDLVIDANIAELYNNHPEILQVEVRGADGERRVRPAASPEVYAIATQELPTKEGERPTYRFLQLRGVEEPEMAGIVHGLSLKKEPGKEHRWFDRTGTEVVMGEGIARTLGLDLGQKFYPRGEPAQSGESRAVLEWTVVGILDSRGSPFDSEIWAKREEVGKYFGKDNEQNKQSFYTSVVVTTKDLPTAERFAKDLQDRTQVRITALTERKYYEEMSKSNLMFQAAALFISLVFAFGAMFGLMTVMFAAVSQRIKDIGVLRILGYGRPQILVSFLLESLLLAVVGGILGLLLGYLVNGVEQTSLVSSGQGGGKTVIFTMLVNRTVLTYAVAFILGMGVVGGLLPALSAMRQRPLESMR